MNVPSSLCTFANISVNGEHYGFFLAIEDADDSYLERLYGAENTVKAYKPEGMDMNERPDGDFPQMPDGQNFPEKTENSDFPQRPDGQNFPERPENGNFPDKMDGGKMPGGMDGGRNGVDLTYIDDNAESYSNIFDNNLNKITDEDKQRLIASLKKISEGEDLESVINVDELLRYIACNVFLVNLDSYLSSNCHNYILTEANGQLSMLPWDYNLSFGTYQLHDASSAVNYAIDTVFNGVSKEERPIIAKLLENETYREKYHEYLRQIAEKYVQSGTFEKTLERVTALIDSYVKEDTTSFCSYDDFTAGTAALKLFMNLRAESVLGQLSGTIPSVSEDQKDSSALVDASALDLTKLGTMKMGR